MAAKVVKSARHYTETAQDEIELLKKVTAVWGHGSAVWGRGSALGELPAFSCVQVAMANPGCPGWTHVVQMYDSFKLFGPHGIRILLQPCILAGGGGGGGGCACSCVALTAQDMVMVFEVLGSNLLRPIIRSNYKGISIPAVKWIVKQVCSAPLHVLSRPVVCTLPCSFWDAPPSMCTA